MKTKRPRPPRKGAPPKTAAPKGAPPKTAAPKDARSRPKPRRELGSSMLAGARPANERPAARPQAQMPHEPETSQAAEARDLDNAPPTTFLPGKGSPPHQQRPVASSEESSEREAAAAAPRPRGPRSSTLLVDGALPDRTPDAVVAQIRELEAQLDRLIDEASRRDVSTLAAPDDEDDTSVLGTARDASPENRHASEDDPDGTKVTQEIEIQPSPPVPGPRPSHPAPVPAARPSTPDRLSGSSLPSEATVFDSARELLSSDFYLRKWGRLAMRGRSEEVDDFGFDPIYDQKARTVLEFLYTRYFRVETSGIERIPTRGRCLLVANHSGTLPLDGVMIKTAVKLEHPAARALRWLAEDFIYNKPFLGSVMNRLGAVRACQENAERLLDKEQLCAVFPEGVKGIGKLFGERYRLQRFGRGGFIKLCLRTGTPIVPVAVVGAEETNPLLFKVEYLAKALGLPYVPVTPTFPALGPIGLLPAPTKWQIHFGEPIDFSGYGRDAADDELLVGKLADRVRATIQGMLDRAVGARKSVFFG